MCSKSLVNEWVIECEKTIWIEFMKIFSNKYVKVTISNDISYDNFEALLSILFMPQKHFLCFTNVEIDIHKL